MEIAPQPAPQQVVDVQKRPLESFQDHFQAYPDVPEPKLKPEVRRVHNHELRLEHALGATAVATMEAILPLEETIFNTAQLKGQAAEAYERRMSSMTTAQKIRYLAKWQARPLPGLRRKIDRLDSDQNSLSTTLAASEARVAELLDEVREKIKEAPEFKNEENRHFIGKTFPPYIQALYSRSNNEALELGRPIQDPVEWLTENTSEGRERLINFVKFNVDRSEKAQDDPELVETYQQEKEEWGEGVRKGIEEGWIQSSHLETITKIDDVTVRFADSFDLSHQDRGGYSIKNKKYIVFGKNKGVIEHAAKHELNHALLGSFSNEHTWLNEAVTEHLAQVINGDRGIEEIFGAGQNEGSDHAYRHPRDLLDSLIELSDNGFSMKQVALAYAKDGPSSSEGEAWLKGKIDRELGVTGSLDKVSTKVAELIAEHMALGKPWRLALTYACGTVGALLRSTPQEVLGQEYTAKVAA